VIELRSEMRAVPERFVDQHDCGGSPSRLFEGDAKVLNPRPAPVEAALLIGLGSLDGSTTRSQASPRRPSRLSRRLPLS
jgi:hypothetical protein